MRHGGRQPDAPARRRQRHQPRNAQCQLIAALGAGQRMHLVHHHAGKRPRTSMAHPASDSSTARLSGVVSRMFGGLGPLARAAVGWRIAGARLDRHWQPHLLTGRVRLRAMSVASAFSGLT